MSTDPNIVLGTKDEVQQLATILVDSGDMQFRQGRFSEAAQHYRRALDIFSKVGDASGEAQCKTSLGRVVLKEGETDRALELFEDALTIQRQLEDKEGMAASLHEIGGLYRGRGDLERALNLHQESYALREELGNESELARVLVEIAGIQRIQGNYDDAIAACEKAKAINERLGERDGLASALRTLGNVHTERGETKKAVTLLKQALTIWDGLGVRDQSAQVLNSIATIYHSDGDHLKAKEFFGRALTIFEEIGDVSQSAAVVNNLGVNAKNLGQFGEAIQHYERALELKRRLGQHQAISNPLNNLAILNYQLGYFRTGIAHAEESLAIKREMKDKKGEINSLLHIARCQGGLEHWDSGRQQIERALELAEELGVRETTCDVLLFATRCAVRLGRWEEAQATSDRSSELARKIKDREFEAIAASLLGELCWWRGDRANGDSQFMTAVNTLGRLESKHLLGVAYFDAGRCYGEHDELDSAASYLERAREIFSSLGAKGWVVKTGLAFGHYCGAHDPVNAAFNLTEAMELAEELGDSEWTEAAREMMRSLRSTVQGVAPGGHLPATKLSALYQLGSTINQILDLDDLLSELLVMVMRNLHAERGGIFVTLQAAASRDDGLDRPSGAADSDLSAEGERRFELARTADGTVIRDADRLAEDIRAQVEENGEPVLGRDVKSDETLRKYAAVRVDGATSLICVPLRIKGALVGTIYVDNLRPGHLFNEDDLDFLAALGNMAAPAIENARLYEDLRLAKEMLDAENVELRREVAQRYQYENFIGTTESMQEVFAMVDKVSKSRVNVLIRGESGTGKELVAKTIHYNSDRQDGPFVKLNCAALPETLVESELFGVERGTATGVEKRIGKFEQASGGTLFLDEIGDMPLTTQVKVLRVLQEREFERVGGRTPIKVDVRVVSATNMDLEQAIAQGTFRSDLYYRLNVVTIKVPAMRERRGDIPSLVKLFLENAANAEGKQISGLTREAWDLLFMHSWPGNVRELENAIEQAVVMCQGEKIAPSHFPVEIRKTAGKTAEGQTPGSLPMPTGVGPLERTLEAAEEAAIRAALERFRGNKSRAAEELCISRVTLYAKMKKYRIR